jgi:hypothetical protein
MRHRCSECFRRPHYNTLIIQRQVPAMDAVEHAINQMRHSEHWPKHILHSVQGNCIFSHNLLSLCLMSVYEREWWPIWSNCCWDWPGYLSRLASCWMSWRDRHWSQQQHSLSSCGMFMQSDLQYLMSVCCVLSVMTPERSTGPWSLYGGKYWCVDTSPRSLIVHS